MGNLNRKYRNPFECTEDEEEFNNFKQDPKLFNAAIYALNNLPDTIYEIVATDYIRINREYLQITIKDGKLVNTNIEIQKYLDDGEIRYIYIRVELITTKKRIQHVNCIVIDKLRKFVLFFEPQGGLKYNRYDLLLIPADYRVISGEDIGYNCFNKLQRYDCFCQTYILYIFLLIIENPDVDYKQFSRLFNSVITNQNLGKFIFWVYRRLQEKEIVVSSTNQLWWYPLTTMSIMANSIRIRFAMPKLIRYDAIDIEEDGDYLII